MGHSACLVLRSPHHHHPSTHPAPHSPPHRQVFAHVLSADGAADPEVMAVSAASAALMCSDMPWAGPVAAARVALARDGQLVVGPTPEQQEGAALNLMVACTADRVTSLEAEGDQVGHGGGGGGGGV